MTNKIDYYLGIFAKEAEEWFTEKDRAKMLKKYDDFFNKEFFKSDYIENLDGKKIERLVNHIHSFNSLALAKFKAKNSDNNSIEQFKKTFSYLIQDFKTDDIYEEMNIRLQNILPQNSQYGLKSWGISSITEIIGECFPEQFVFYNRRDQEAVKFLEIDIYENKKKKDNVYIAYNKAIQPLIKKYKSTVEFKSGYPIGIEIDQFFSWIYTKFVGAVEEMGKEIGEEELSPIIHGYFEEIQIQNYFSINDIQLKDFSKEVYLLGENGVGKTLLLQAILLSTKFNYIEKVTNKTYTGVVLQHLTESKKICNNQDFTFTTHTRDIINEDSGLDKNIFMKDKDEEIIKPNLYLKNIFAYGVNRAYIPGENNQYEFLTLFSNKNSLISPVEWLIKLHNQEADEKLNNVATPHVSLVQAKDMIVALLERNILIQTSYNKIIFKEGGTELSFEQLSDGYKSVMTWLIDMIARLSENQPNINDIKEFRGILLIDELDLFLHPQWSYNIVNKLREWLPEFQFIISTHSPILTLGASEDAIFYKLYKENGETKISSPLPLQAYYKNMTANSLITSLLWGLDTFTNRGIASEYINSDDYIFQKIHDIIAKRMKDSPPSQLTEEYVIDLIEQELSNWNIK